MSEAPERVWIDPGAMEVVQKKHDPDYDIQYIRADVSAAHIADLKRHLAEREAQVARLLEMQAEREVDHERQLAEAREVKPHHAEMLAKEMQAIVAADRWKGRDLSAAPPEKWSHLRPETQQFWIDTAARILAALKPPGPSLAEAREVKPLQWEYHADRGIWTAEGVFGTIYTVSDGQWWRAGMLQSKWVGGEDELPAKAAAQADYTARILSALKDPTP